MVSPAPNAIAQRLAAGACKRRPGKPKDGLPLPGGFAGPPASDTETVGEKHAVECLRCGRFRTIERNRNQRLEPGECPQCGYLGWALIADLSEPVRRTLRERAPGPRFRRLRAV